MLIDIEGTARRRASAAEAAPLLPLASPDAPTQPPSRTVSNGTEDSESEGESDDGGRSSGGRRRGVSTVAALTHLSQFFQHSQGLPFLVLFLLRFLNEHLDSITFFFASTFAIIAAEEELRRQLALRRGRSLMTLNKVACAALLGLVFMYTFMDFHPRLHQHLWYQLTSDTYHTPHTHHALSAEPMPMATAGGGGGEHELGGGGEHELGGGGEGLGDLNDAGAVFWVIYCSDVALRAMCIFFKAFFIVAWIGYHQGPGVSLRLARQLFPRVAALFNRVTQDGRSQRDVEEGLELRSLELFDEDDAVLSRQLHLQLRDILWCAEAICLLIRVVLPTPVWAAYYMASHHGDVIASMYVSCKFFSTLWMMRMVYAAMRQACRDRNSGLAHGRFATREDFGAAGCGDVVLANGSSSSNPESQEAKSGEPDRVNEVSLDCPICFNHYHRPVVLPCNHMFCETCIGEWLHEQSTCPLCRVEVNSNPNAYPLPLPLP
mmetsp:Transcript_26836/g.84118  ORF Transcript_26836/g.84118 Transcript_26836/m.84118 type:complete len:490 (-) Transcript_26836:289-1758(-)